MPASIITGVISTSDRGSLVDVFIGGTMMLAGMAGFEPAFSTLTGWHPTIGRHRVDYAPND